MVSYLYLRGTFEERILIRLIAKYERQRQRLTFVPNTLGVTTSTDAGSERLLKGLMDEDTKLFRDDGTRFSFTADDENEGADEAAAELLEEVDRALKGFADATQANVWLGDAGLNAEERLLEEAAEARDAGNRVGTVDLARFVCDAILLEGGDVSGNLDDEVFAVRLPPVWSFGLDELPGYDADTRLIRLTTRLNVTRDGHQRTVGYLGRAHPLVRRALDRVRNLSYGGNAKYGQDPRASVVTYGGGEHALLYTFLGRVASRAGREFERVLAVKITRGGGVHFHDSADQWLNMADPAKAIRTTDVWEQQFVSWAPNAEHAARQAAESGFEPIAGAYLDERRRALETERKDQDRWLQQRSQEITGTSTAPVQYTLFETDDAALPAETRQWAALEDQLERLAAFAADSAQHPAKRSEADGVLRIHRQRLADLEAKLALSDPEVVPLGVLMLVPGGMGKQPLARARSRTGKQVCPCHPQQQVPEGGHGA